MNNEVTSVEGRIQSGQQTIGTSRVTLTGDVKLSRGVTIIAGAGNAGIVYVGSPEVTATSGYPLIAGATLFVPARFCSQINLIASLAAQGVSWVAI